MRSTNLRTLVGIKPVFIIPDEKRTQRMKMFQLFRYRIWGKMKKKNVKKNYSSTRIQGKNY